MAIGRMCLGIAALTIGNERRCRRVGFLLAILLGGASVACTEINYTVGTPIETAALDRSLQVGVSTAADVRAVLGEPTGRGSTQLPIDPEPRETWYYYHEKGRVGEATGTAPEVEMRRTFLFVYLDDGRYDGYMWFSSLAE